MYQVEDEIRLCCERINECEQELHLATDSKLIAFLRSREKSLRKKEIILRKERYLLIKRDVRLNSMTKDYQGKIYIIIPPKWWSCMNS